MGKRGLFLKNAVLLTGATLLLRMLGMVFRIVISNRLGAEGMGLYQIVVSVYMLASTLASAGLSIAVTRLVSEEQLTAGRAALKKLMAFCMGVAAALGSAVGLGLYAAAGVLARYWVGEPDAAASLQVLALSLPFMAVSACLRGYFTARRRVGFSSLAQLLEQGVKFSVCMGLIALWGVRSTTFGCLLVMAADTASEWFSFAFQYVGYRADARRLPHAAPQGAAAGAGGAAAPAQKTASQPGKPVTRSEKPAAAQNLTHRPKKPAAEGKNFLSKPKKPAAGAQDPTSRPKKSTAGAQGRAPSLGRRLAEIALPIAGVRIIGSTLYTVENTLVPALLEGHLARSRAGAHALALAQWGQLKGMGIPVVMFPSTLLASFVLLLVPELSEYRAASRDRQARQLIGLSLHVTLAASIGLAAGLYLLAEPICELLYPGQGIGFYVQVLAPLAPFMYLENVAEGMLKGLGEQKVTLRYSLINVAVRLVLIALLVPYSGMRGFLWMMLVDNVVTSLLHTCRVLNVVQMRLQWPRWVLRPLGCAAAVSAAGAFAAHRLGALGWQPLGLLLAVGGGMALGYLALLWCVGCFTRQDLQLILGRKKR